VSNARRVAITGLGAISAVGVGVQAFWDGLLAGRGGFRRIERFDPSTLLVPIAAEVPDFAPPVLEGSQIELLDRFSQFALVAAGEACEQANLNVDDAEGDRVGVAVGSGFGGCLTQDDRYQRIYGKGEVRVRMMIQGKESILALLAAGEFFGEISLFDHGARSADVVANEDSVLLRMGARSFEKMVDEAPDVAAPFLFAMGKTLTSRIRADNKRFSESVIFTRMGKAISASAEE